MSLPLSNSGTIGGSGVIPGSPTSWGTVVTGITFTFSVAPTGSGIDTLIAFDNSSTFGTNTIDIALQIQSPNSNAEFPGGPAFGSVPYPNPISVSGTLFLSSAGTFTLYGSCAGAYSFVKINTALTGLEYYQMQGTGGVGSAVLSCTIAQFTPATETLTLSTAKINSAGSLVCTGVVANGFLTNSINLSTGGTFFSSSTFTLNSNTWTATAGTLSAGSYTIEAQDPNSGVDSNTLPLLVSNETITLTSLGGTLGALLTFGGTSSNGPPPNVNVGINSVFTLSNSFTTTSGTLNAPLSGTAGVITSAGTYAVQLQDAVQNNVFSNTLDLIVEQPPVISSTGGGNLGRYRGAVGINFYGQTLIGDAFAGVLGAANFSMYQEYGQNMHGLITSPPLHRDRRRIFVPRFEIDVESGVGQPFGDGSNPLWMLDISRDGGRTFGPQQVFRSMGALGEYTTRLRWLRLGQARQWIFRLQSTDPVRRVIIGTYVDFYEGMGGSSQ